jgi:hypothetical protein
MSKTIFVWVPGSSSAFNERVKGFDASSHAVPAVESLRLQEFNRPHPAVDGHRAPGTGQHGAFQIFRIINTGK